MRCIAPVGERASNALKGKRVVVTRAAEQSEQLVKELKERGAVPVLLPMVAFASPDDSAPLDEAIRELSTYDWVFVTSQNAFRALRERCGLLKVNLLETFSGVKIAAVGPATAEAVENTGLRVSYVASKHQGVALAAELATEVRGKRVLLLRSDRASPELVEELKRLGTDVTEVCAYKTIRPEKSDLDAAARTVEEADAVLFFSPSAVHHLQELVGNEKFLKVSRRSVFAAIGPVTEEALRRADVERVLVARDTSVTAVVEALEDYFAREGAGGGRNAQPRREARSGQAGMAVPRSAEVKPR